MEKKKIVLIGAGSAVFTKGLIADFIRSDFGSWEIALCDLNPTILEAVTKLAKKMVEYKHQEDRITISSSTDRTKLLPGADFVVTTIAVGGREAWLNDVKIPRKYGIYQPVGDSVMPGGIARAQRMIPQMVAIARDVEKYCPNAYFFNYSNPMTAITTAVRKVTDVKMIGLCHGVIYGTRYLARMMQVDVKRVSTIGVGLNHLTFFYDIRVDGEDATPRLAEIIQKQKEDAEKNGHVANFFNSQLDDTEIPNYLDNPFSWELWQRYHGLPAVVDRHANEFFPERFPHGQFYGRTLGIDAFPIEEVINRGEKTYRDMLKQGEEGVRIDDSLFNKAEGEHEQLVEMIKSLLLDERKTFSINVPNHGAVQGLPDDAVLELPGIATARGFMPMTIDDGFTPELKGIIARKLAPVNMTVKAALEGDRDAWVEALLLDGAVTSEDVAEKLVDDYMAAYNNDEHTWLPQYKK